MADEIGKLADLAQCLMNISDTEAPLPEDQSCIAPDVIPGVKLKQA